LVLTAPCVVRAQDQAPAQTPAPAETSVPAEHAAPATAPSASQTTALTGNIVSHDGDKLVVRVSGVDMPMTLAAGAQVQQMVGVAGLRREDHPATDLIKGLNVTVDTYQAGGQTYVSKATFNGNDLKTAKAINAGVEEGKQKIIAAQAENERQQAENRRRLSLVGQFSQKGQTRVYFATGSAAINEEGKQNLQAIAAKAMATPGALVRVVGFTDSTGSAATNQRLSNQRASAVTAYLLQQARLPPEKIATAGGLGSYVPVDNEEPGAGSAQNRRVTVFVLVSKAAETDVTPASASTGVSRTAP
jgi:outer membrane protein OmpA-like peptidoglycan-associated protein